MKKIFLFLIGCLFGLNILAQSADPNAITVSPYVAPNSGVPASAETVLETKLRNLINASGMISDANQRFILTAHVTPITEDVTPTTPPKYAYTLNISLYIGDGITGKLFASSSFETKGVGNSKEKAYLAALKALNPGDPKLKSMIREGREKVMQYYMSQGPAILQEAQAAAKSQNYEQALFLLDQIPSACGDLYSKANNLKVQVYQSWTAEDAARELAEAKAIWNAGQDRAAADKAGAILAKINPQSPAYKEAQQLHNQIAARVKALDTREWNFQLQQQRDETSIKKAQLQAAKEVAVAKAKNQPKTIYRIYWW